MDVGGSLSILAPAILNMSFFLIILFFLIYNIFLN